MSVLNKVLNKFKKDSSVKSLNDVDLFKDQQYWVPFGSPSLDYKLSTLGLSVGITEIRGESKGGKTTLSLHLIKNFQAMFPENGIACILSTERRDNKPYAEKIGVDVNNLMIAQCRTIEDVFMKVQNVIKETEAVWKEENLEGKPKFMFVWDSVGASISAQELSKMEESAESGEADDQFRAAMGSAARSIKRGLRYLQGEVYNKDIFFVMINHVYDSIGGFSGGKNSYGGKGIEYMPNMRINVSRTGFIKHADIKRGQESVIEVVKSDFNSSLEKIKIEISFGSGIIMSQEEIDFAVEHGIVERKGKTGFSFMGKMEWNSRRQFYDIFDDNNPLYKILLKKVTKKYHELVVAERERKESVVRKVVVEEDEE